MAVAALVLGIIGVVPSITAIIFSMISLKHVNNGFGIAGLVCALSGLTIGAIAMIMAIVVLV